MKSATDPNVRVANQDGAMTLFAVPVSAFAAKVRIALDFKGLPYTESLPPDGYGSPAYRALVPAGSVPGIVYQGRALHDSNAIIEFVNALQPEPPLMPADPWRQALVRALLGYHDTRVEAAARQMFPLLKGDWQHQPAVVADAVQTMNTVLTRLAELVKPSPFAIGSQFSLADCAYPVTVQTIRMLAAHVQQPVVVPEPVDAWLEHIGELAAVQRSLKIAGDAMQDWLKDLP